MPIAAKWIGKLPKTQLQLDFLKNLSHYTCIPSGSSKVFLNAGSRVLAFSMFVIFFTIHYYSGTVLSSMKMAMIR